MTRAVTRPGVVSLLVSGLVLCGCSGAVSKADASTTTSPAVATSATPTVATNTTLNSDGLLEKVRDSVMRVRTTGCGELATGSSWLIGARELVTNRHVVDGAHKVEVTTWDGYDLETSSVRVATTHDVARLQLPSTSRVVGAPLEVRSDRVESGERIFIVGYPEGNEVSVSSGVAVEYAPSPDPDDPVEVLKATTIIQPGNSGGPAFDVNGQVVGVVFAEELAVDEALIIPIDTVLSMPGSDFVQEPDCR